MSLSTILSFLSGLLSSRSDPHNFFEEEGRMSLTLRILKLPDQLAWENTPLFGFVCLLPPDQVQVIFQQENCIFNSVSEHHDRSHMMSVCPIAGVCVTLD